jgi:transaldolase
MAGNIAPESDLKNRLCFKIVSTWPGLAAAKILEEKGVAALGTALFCMEQASLAGSMGCTYISPYFNELKVHFDKECVFPRGLSSLPFLSFPPFLSSLSSISSLSFLSPPSSPANSHSHSTRFRDEHKATTLCRDAAAYYASRSHKTKVKAASFVAPDECMHHAGVDYITLFPDIINALASAPLESMPAAEVGKYMAPPSVAPAADWKVLDEAIAGGREAWEASMEKSAGGESARKLKEAITVFSGMQDNLEALIGKV